MTRVNLCASAHRVHPAQAERERLLGRCEIRRSEIVLLAGLTKLEWQLGVGVGGGSSISGLELPLAPANATFTLLGSLNPKHLMSVPDVTMSTPIAMPEYGRGCSGAERDLVSGPHAGDQGQ